MRQLLARAMQWMFTKLGRDRKHDAAPVEHEKDQGYDPLLPLHFGSAKELLALQQLIGNQAVLRMIAPGRSGATSPELNQGTDRS